MTPPRDDAPTAISVPEECAAAWHALPRRIRCHVDAFLGGAPSGVRVATRVRDAPPRLFLDDLVSGGLRLREAFPVLARKVVAIHAEPITLEVACEGVHVGPFFDIISASQRRVCFVETHLFVRARNGSLSDLVYVDYANVIRQIAGFTPDRAPP